MAPQEPARMKNDDIITLSSSGQTMLQDLIRTKVVAFKTARAVGAIVDSLGWVQDRPVSHSTRQECLAKVDEVRALLESIADGYDSIGCIAGSRAKEAAAEDGVSVAHLKLAVVEMRAQSEQMEDPVKQLEGILEEQSKAAPSVLSVEVRRRVATLVGTLEVKTCCSVNKLEERLGLTGWNKLEGGLWLTGASGEH